MDLLSNEDVPGGMVNKVGATHVLLIWVFLAEGMSQSSSCQAHEVVDQHLLTWEQAILLECALLVLNGLMSCTRSGLMMLLSILANGTMGVMLQLTGSCLEPSGILTVGQDTSLHQKLNFSLGEVSKTKVPMQQFLLCWGEVHI